MTILQNEIVGASTSDLKPGLAPHKSRSAVALSEPGSSCRRTNMCLKPPRHRPVSAEATRILDDVRRAMDWDPERARAAALQLVRVLTLTTEAESAGPRGGLAPWQKRKVDRYLSEHLSRPLHTKEIASQVSLSIGHFSRAFKDSYGSPPHTHIVGLRLELAQRLMLTTEESLSQIALACGMADQSHLSKLFRRGVGETPGAWRRRRLPDAEAEDRGGGSNTGRSVNMGV